MIFSQSKHVEHIPCIELSGWLLAAVQIPFIQMKFVSACSILLYVIFLHDLRHPDDSFLFATEIRFSSASKFGLKKPSTPKTLNYTNIFMFIHIQMFIYCMN